MRTQARRWGRLVWVVLVCAMSGSTLEAAQSKTDLVDQFTFVTNGQQWTDAQKEVWKAVQSYWQVDTIDALMDRIHPDYIGWGPVDPMPADKPTCRLQLANLMNTRKSHIITIAPAGMRLFGNVAVACYYYTELYTNFEGKRCVEQGRWTDVLMKQDGKWLLIADHGGPLANEDDD